MSRHVNSLINVDFNRIFIIGTQLNDFFCKLTKSITSQRGIYSNSSVFLSENELISQCRSSLHWIYEIKTLFKSQKIPTKSTSKNKKDLNPVEFHQSTFIIGIEFVKTITQYSLTPSSSSHLNSSRWEWDLYNDLSSQGSSPLKLFASSIDINNLNSLDKGLISKLLVNCLKGEFQENQIINCDDDDKLNCKTYVGRIELHFPY